MKATKLYSTKENLFGTIDRTPGQNLMRAVTGSGQPIGIPPYHYGKMLDIMRQALTTAEVDLLCRGYGFNRPRQLQKEIAAELNLDARELSNRAHQAVRKLQGSPYKSQLKALVSNRAHQAVRKLQGSPYKSQLKALVPTLEALFDEIAELRNANAALQRNQSHDKSLAKLERRCQQTQALLTQSEAARKNSEADKARLTYEVECLNRELGAKSAQLSEVQGQAARLASQVVQERARAEAVKLAFDETLEEAKARFAAKLTEVEQGTRTLAELHLSSDALERLQRAGVRNLDTLCNMSSHALSRLGVGGKNLAEIQRKLSAQGLSLRAS